MGPAGYLDDLALAAYVLNNIINNSPIEILKRNWAGEKDIIKLIQKILNNIENIISSGIWAKVQTIFAKWRFA